MIHVNEDDIVWSSLRFIVDGNTVTIFVLTNLPGKEEVAIKLYPRHPALFKLIAGLPDKSKFVKNFIRKRLEWAINEAPS